MRRGLVLEGGAMRGMFTAGILDVFLENGIEFDGTVGVSAGAVFGCNYKSRQVGRTIRYNTKYCRDKRYHSLRNLIATGDLYGADFCYREIPEKLDIFDVKTYQENPMVFYVVCTDAETGAPIYRRCDKGTGEDLVWMRGSASLPLVSRPVLAEDRFLLDGGMSDSIPLRFMQGVGYDKNVVILTRPRGYVKKKLKGALAFRLALRHFPGLWEAMKSRHTMYNAQVAYVEEEEKRGNVFVLRPPHALKVGKTERSPQRLFAAYYTGRQTAEENLDALQAFLGE